MSVPESDENKKWFVNRVDSVIQNIIDVQESDYDTFSSTVTDSDDELIRVRNAVWQIIAVIAAAAIAVTQVSMLKLSLLIDTIAFLLVLGVAWTLWVQYLRNIIIPRMEKVREVHFSTRISMLYVQSWFQSHTMTVSKISQEKLDLYFDFVRVALASLSSNVLEKTVRFQLEMRLLKSGEPLNPELQRVETYVAEGYKLFKEKRNGLTNPVNFSPNLRAMLAPFETKYLGEQNDANSA